MSGLFGGGKQPKMPTPIVQPPPVIQDAAGAGQDQSDELRRRRGAASTVLSTPETTGNPKTGAKVLLGA